ncbi:hypothetical protein ACVR05_06885 [Streptococcus caprae]|uniref:Amino acid transporter n=1 Tax=Streptococcus caprae TaxID=1640501 RepID=A0ABV8CVX6_9STRE
MTLFSAIFTSVFKRRDVKILLAFMVLPILGPALSGVSESQLDLDIYGNFLSFMTSSLDLQFQLVLPALIMGFIVSSVFQEEIATGILFLYKDINRKRILKAKLQSLYLVYALYWLGTVVVSMLVYLVYVVPKAGFHFLPTDNLTQLVLQNISNICLNLILITLIAAVSIKKKTLMAVLLGVLFNCVALTAPLLNGFRYVFPNTYPRLLDKIPFPVALAMSLGISLLYLALAYVKAHQNFKKIEF